MVPPIWLDETGAPLPTRPCLRCGRPTPIVRYRISTVKNVGWQLFAPCLVVEWCGHSQEWIPMPASDGWIDLVPILGEATR